MSNSEIGFDTALMERAAFGDFLLALKVLEQLSNQKASAIIDWTTEFSKIRLRSRPRTFDSSSLAIA
jgi:hypothetical protein